MLYPLLGLSQQPGLYIQSLKRTQPAILSAMALAVVTGGIRVVQAGGFKALPIPFHIKIALGLVMLIATLVQYFYCLPKAEQALASGQNPQDAHLISGLLRCGGLVVLCVVAILAILAGLGLLLSWN